MDTQGAGTDGVGSRSDPATAHLELHQVVVGSESLTQVLDRVAHLATRAVPDVDEVSVTFVEEGRGRTVVFTGQLAVQLDERQYADGFGPCLDAAATGRIVQVPDTANDSSYPDFAGQAVRSGVTRTLSVGMPVHGRTTGALNMYGFRGTGWDDLTIAMADGFAAHAGVALANAALYARAVDEVSQMREAMASRAVIEQAKGMVMAARGCTADEAFAELGRMSAQANRKLRDIAEDVVSDLGRSL
ncbi:GAF and ANTAR domain-containing protein [Aquipuribacter hungaricus]|uniref:GAF and ANTAR domain-containing protein n=1 Tax=Aquipuribacter hungaricus TaxID=545624 RepID=A0ABV7WIM5_9MICO